MTRSSATWPLWVLTAVLGTPVAPLANAEDFLPLPNLGTASTVPVAAPMEDHTLGLLVASRMGEPLAEPTWPASDTAGPLLNSPGSAEHTAPAQPAPSASAANASQSAASPAANPAPTAESAAEAQSRALYSLMTAPDAPARTPELEATAREADRHSRRAFDLAERNAYFAARSEWIVAMRLVAQALDTQTRTNRHSQALADGLTALREVEDFLPRGGHLEADLDLVMIIRGHRTPVLKQVDRSLTALEAIKCYFNFAQEQLAVATGHELAGSMALYGLGKLHSTLSGQTNGPLVAAESKAMVFLQASLLACPHNYMASNELGVLLARGGHYAEARTALEHSVSISRQASGWQNLAAVYRQLGDLERAQRAQQLAEMTLQGRLPSCVPGVGTSPVQWMDAGAFSQSFADTASARDPLPAHGTPGNSTAQRPGDPTLLRQ